MAEILPYVQVETLDHNLFRGINLWKPANGRSVFGGQLVAQALHAAIKTIDASTHVPHSIHSYFLLPGKLNQAIYYQVIHIRDGRSYTVRRVDAIQRGHIIFTANISFQRLDITAAEGVAHAYGMPLDVPDPDDVPDMTTRLNRVLADERLPDFFRDRITELLNEVNPIDFRYCRRSDPLNPQPEPPRQLAWFRCKTRIPDCASGGTGSSDGLFPTDPSDRLLHFIAVAYASDFAILGTALLPHRSPNPGVSFMASLDHTIWFHAPCRADDWLLYELEAPRLVHGRGLGFGRIYRRDGVLVASTAQEGVVRFRPDYAAESPIVIKRAKSSEGVVWEVEADDNSLPPVAPLSSAKGIIAQPTPTWGATPLDKLKAKL